MHMTVIQHDIGSNKVSGMEDAFRVLVGWPKEDTIHGATAMALDEALGVLCDKLASNERIMPGATTDLISAVIGEPIGGTYADGALAVSENIDAFTSAFETLENVDDAA